ncbi:MAG: saccharopine dehydrogenase NADP-binding domain-containing protein [Planctomycetota bacterium]|nr:saccharopine dehydrogenase NADP-binding domain-containing protein [Planctomycetota bacterium]
MTSDTAPVKITAHQRSQRDEASLSEKPYLIYGAYGYTGELTARLAKEKGHKPILAGRNEQKVKAIATELGFEHRVYSLDDIPAREKALEDVELVLHCAGPFSKTAEAMSEACLHTKTHYLDVTGEVEVFELLATKNEVAKEAEIMILPGVGFDVVPSDCLALHLKQRLPDATHLALGFHSQGKSSRGTANTIVENINNGGVIRENGVIIKVKPAAKSRMIDFGRGKTLGVTIPWGDVSTAYHSTQIPNIEVYMAVPAVTKWAMKSTQILGKLLATKPIQNFLKKRIQKGPAGPTEEQRAEWKTCLWGEATNAAGRKVVSRLVGPEGYTLTARTALAIIERVLSGDAPIGYQTPASAYGADLITEIEGVTRSDEE